MPDELLAGQDTPAVPSQAQPTAPVQENAGTDAPGAETEGSETETQNDEEKITLTKRELKDQLERVSAKAAAKAERRALREAKEILMQGVSRQDQPTHQSTADQRPQRQQYASEEAYEDAVYDWRRGNDEKVERAKSQEVQQRTMGQKTEKIYAEAEKLSGLDRDDLDEVAGKLTPAIAQALVESDVAPKLLSYMAQHPEDVQRISALSPARQAAEIGKLETKLANTAKPPKVSAPIEPISGSATPTKNLTTMSAEDYYAARMKQRPVWARR